MCSKRIRIVVRNKNSGAENVITGTRTGYAVCTEGDVTEIQRALQYAIGNGYDGGQFPFDDGDTIHIERVES